MLRCCLLLLVLGTISCSMTDTPADTRGPEDVSQPAAAEPSAFEALGATEDPRDRRQRLLRLEHACDQWYSAWVQQEFSRMASLEILLRDSTNRAFAEVLSDLRTGSPRHKRVMAAALGFSGRAEAVPALLAALEEQYYEVVLHSLLSLYRLCDPRNAETAKAAAVQIDPERIVNWLAHPKPEVRSNAALVISRVASPATSKAVLLALISLADDMEPRVRLHALAALSATRAPEVFPQLVKALSDTFELVRIRAAFGLARLKNIEAAPYLIELLAKADETTNVKQAVARALGALLGVPEDLALKAEHWRELLRAKAAK
ncbi:MAG: HEAT repeat domain-containing protein [Planctomycetes bacterium]|nr:HEAT repeat domain-containing protein [Planctomycetota bacterium]